MKKDRVPGCAIVLLDERGILWTEGFGYTDRRKRIPVTPGTPFLLCSISKTVTATAVMLGVQDGLLDLDAPITTYLPDFHVNSRYEGRAERKITLRRLLTHTAGLPLDSPVGNIFQVTGSFDQHARSAYGIWLICPVGEAFSYSNIGIDLAAYALQEAAGMPFERYVKERLLLPLGMSKSLLDSREILQSANRAVGHATAFARMPSVIPAIGAGGIYAGATDLSRFVQLHLNKGAFGGRRLLDESLVAAMYVPHAVTSEPNTYGGLGFGVVDRDDHGDYCLRHRGTGYGFDTVMRIYPEYGVGEVILTNRMPSSAFADLSIASRLIRDGMVEKRFPMRTVPGTNCVSPWGGLPEHEASPYQREWQKYCGTYDLVFSGYEFEWWARLGVALLRPDEHLPCIRVYREKGHLCVTESRFFKVRLGRMWNWQVAEELEETGPGLFSTASGAVLDLHGKVPFWRNYRLVKR